MPRGPTRMPRWSSMSSGIRTGLVPVRQPRRAPGSSTAVSTTRTLRLLRAGGSPASSLTRGTAARASREPALEGALAQIAAARRRPCRGDLRGDHRPRGSGPLPVQRDGRAVRAERLHPRRPGRQTRMDREQGDPAGLSIAQAVGSPQLPEQHPDLLDAAGCASSAYPGDGRARVAPLSVQNDHFCVPSAGPAGSAPAVHNEGGYLKPIWDKPWWQGPGKVVN